MWWFRRRTELEQRAQDAAQEARAARERRDRGAEEVVKPLRKAARENRFAKMIRDSLLHGD